MKFGAKRRGGGSRGSGFPTLEVSLPSLHGTKSADRDLLSRHLAELGQNTRATIGLVHMRHEVGPLRPDQDAVQFEGGLLGINCPTNLAALFSAWSRALRNAFNQSNTTRLICSATSAILGVVSWPATIRCPKVERSRGTGLNDREQKEDVPRA